METRMPELLDHHIRHGNWTGEDAYGVSAAVGEYRPGLSWEGGDHVGGRDDLYNAEHTRQEYHDASLDIPVFHLGFNQREGSAAAEGDMRFALEVIKRQLVGDARVIGADQANILLVEQGLLVEPGLHVGNESAKRQISITALQQARRVLVQGQGLNFTFGAQLRMCCSMSGSKVVCAPSGTHIRSINNRWKFVVLAARSFCAIIAPVVLTLLATGVLMTVKPELNKRDWIAGLEKGIRIIEAFNDAHPRLTA